MIVKRISGLTIKDNHPLLIGSDDGKAMADFIEALYAFGFVKGGNYGLIDIEETEYEVTHLEEMADRMYMDFVKGEPA